jgi:hypothetical protein
VQTAVSAQVITLGDSPSARNTLCARTVPARMVGVPPRLRPPDHGDREVLRTALRSSAVRRDPLRKLVVAIAAGHRSHPGIGLGERIAAGNDALDAFLASPATTRDRDEITELAGRYVRSAMHALDHAATSATRPLDEVAAARARRNEELRLAKLRHPTTYLIARRS